MLRNVPQKLPGEAEIADGMGEVANRVSQLGNTVRHTGKFTIKVLAGNHAGTAIMLEPGEYVIGSGADCDIVLFADNLASRHAKIQLPSNLLRNVRVTPVEKRISIEGEDIVEVGQYADIGNNEQFSLANSVIGIERIGSPTTYLKTLLRVIAIIALIALVPLAYNVFKSVMNSAMAAGSSSVTSIANVIRDTGGSIIAQSSDNQPTPDAYVWAVRTKLQELGLNHRLRASQSGDGPLYVSGNISDNELQRWTAFLQWYDQKTTFPPLVRDVQRGQAANDLPKIKSVWFEDVPSVQFANGTTAKVGDRLGSGWQVVEITSSAVIIERSGAKVSLTY